MDVWMYVCVCTYLCVCVCVYIYIHIHVYVYVCMYVCMQYHRLIWYMRPINLQQNTTRGTYLQLTCREITIEIKTCFVF